jgi:hypothetical protein
MFKGAFKCCVLCEFEQIGLNGFEWMSLNGHV